MDTNTNNPVTIARVAFEHEAVSVVAALKDAGIAAYFQPIASVGLLALPGAYGMPQNGFEVVVAESDEDKAADIVTGIGVGAADGVPEAAELASPSEEAATEDQPEIADKTDEASDAEDDVVENTRSPFAGVLLTILALVGIAVFVWLCDWVIEWVVSLAR